MGAVVGFGPRATPAKGEEIIGVYREIIWREVALDSLERARAYIAQDNPAAAARVRERILSAVRHLADMPDMGRPGRVEDTRELIVSGTLYIVAYTMLDNHVMILAVQHGAQEWPDRF